MRALGEFVARVGLFLVGATMCVEPCVAVLSSGWAAAPLLPLAFLGVVLVILAAFYSRISGTVRLGRFFEVPIAPPRESRPQPPTPARRRVRGSA